jgi:hypothetical protein
MQFQSALRHLAVLEHKTVELILTVATAFIGGYLLSCLFFLVRRMDYLHRFLLLLLITLLTLACPLLIPQQYPVVRCLIATTLVFFVIKSWDVHLSPASYRDMPPHKYVVFLMNHCLLTFRGFDRSRTHHPLRYRIRFLVVKTIRMFLASMVLFGVFKFRWADYSFWPEHMVKAACSFMWVVSAFEWYGAIWRAAGSKTVSYASRLPAVYSPAGFWRHCHRPVHQWFFEDVYGRLNRYMPPSPAVLLTFLVSGLLHEYIIAVSIGHFTGYMLVFFMLQGLATLLTWQLKLSGAARLAGVLVTCAFLAASSVFFFVAVNEGISFYANHPPLWIRL